MQTLAIRRGSRFVPVIVDSQAGQCRSPCNLSGSQGERGEAFYGGLGDRSIRRAARASDATYRTLAALRDDYPDALRRRDLDL